MTFLDTITTYYLPVDQFYPEEHAKKQIILHHTAGNANPYNVIDDWHSTPVHVGTAFVIGGRPVSSTSNWYDGKILQAFPSKYWCYSLGLKSSPGKPPKQIEQESVAIEVCNWGPLTKHEDGSFTNYVNQKINPAEVTDLGHTYRGFQYFHSYTDAQIESLRQLMIFLGNKYSIPLKYKGDTMFDYSPLAFTEPGVWTHVSVRKDKTDMYPSPKLIAMLKTL